MEMYDVAEGSGRHLTGGGMLKPSPKHDTQRMPNDDNNNNNNNESIYYAPCIRVIKPAQRRFTIVHSIPE